jgi:murein DD-endopeptidase MepM/ murein hydrolase activator NlpD
MKRLLSGIVAAITLFGGLPVAMTQAVENANEQDLTKELNAKQGRVKELDALIDAYQGRIQQGQTEAATLENQMELLENRIAEKTLSVERARTEIDALTLEIKHIEQEIGAQEARANKQTALLADLIRRIQRGDDTSTLEILLGKPSLSSFFAEMEEVRRLQRDLGTMLEHVKTIKAGLAEKQRAREESQQALIKERASLVREQRTLEAEHNYKTSLITETKNRERDFERIMYELSQEKQETSGSIAEIETRLKERLKTVDEALARGDILFNWPVDVSKGITALFHDPTYPFRHLFEHPGVDIRASVGTTVKAAAGGYVAWNKTGRMYGNYTMIVHPGGFATVYAHLSKFLVQPDTYVERGDAIALSGGRPGDAGAGLSSGPHLHFEVREDGIPVNPENYLPTLPPDYFDYYEEYQALKVKQ